MALATTVAVSEQNVAEFKELLGRVLAFDADSSPENRLVTILVGDAAQIEAPVKALGIGDVGVVTG